MSEQWTTRLQKRMIALYRYTHAMENGDIETVSEMLAEAEHDRVLERMILEVNEGYQIEDRTVAHADDIEIVQNILREMTPTLPMIPAIKDQSTQSTPTGKKSIPHTRAAHRNENVSPGYTPPRTSLKKLIRSRYSWFSAVAAILLILISVPATNVLAEKFLDLFRVQQFQPVSIDSQKSAQILFTTLQNLGTLQHQQRNSSSNRHNLTEAQAESIIGYQVLLPSRLPAGVSGQQDIAVVGGDQVTYTFDAAKAQAYLIKNGEDSVAIPSVLNGASYTITVAPSVDVNYSACPQKQASCQPGTMFFLHEVADPLVQSNGNASITQLRDFLLSLPNLPASARDLLKHLDEKTGTIPVPIPPQASAELVTVHGTSGLFLKSNTMSAAIWETQGIIYILALGTNDQTQVLDAANSLT